MNADGSGRVPITPLNVEFSGPSMKTYGGIRWFVVTKETGDIYDEVILGDGSVIYDQPHQDLFARAYIDGQVVDIQLTDYFGAYRISPRTDYRLSQPTWSNDGQDSFISVLAEDVTGAVTVAENGDVVLDKRLAHFVWARLWISGSEISTGFVPITESSQRFEGVLLNGFAPGEEVTCVHWSPANDQLVAITSVVALEPGDSLCTLWVVDVLGGGQLLSLPADGVLIHDRVARRIGGPVAPAWSPDGNRIAFYAKPEASGGHGSLRTIAPDGTSLTTVYQLTFTDTTGVVDPSWSPDSAHLLLGQASTRGLELIYSLGRIRLADGAIVTLTKGLDVYEKKTGILWSE